MDSSVSVQASTLGVSQVRAERIKPEIGELRAGFGPPAGPADIHFLQEYTYPDLFLVVRVDKLLAESGLAESIADGNRKMKQRAVRINSELVEKVKLALPRMPCQLTVKAGRLIKTVEVL
jgi:hypothetical protein